MVKDNEGSVLYKYIYPVLFLSWYVLVHEIKFEHLLMHLYFNLQAKKMNVRVPVRGHSLSTTNAGMEIN